MKGLYKISCSILLIILLLPVYGQVKRIQLNEHWKFTQEGENQWLDAIVPGSVHTDLYANGKIEDPFYRMNEKDLQWIGFENWEYNTDFQVEASLINMDRVELVFEGLDTYAEVAVNGKKVLDANNMFRDWRVDVKDLLITGKNTISIVFRSPINEVMPQYEAMGYEIPVSNNDQSDTKVSVYSRKAGYHFGWDWGPRFVTCGVWKPVYMEGWNTARINDLFVEQVELNDQVANLNAVLEIPAASKSKVTVEIKVNDEAVSEIETQVLEGNNQFSLPFQIKDPLRWWPNGLGDQHLYKVEAVLKGNSNVLDDAKTRIGLRTIELVRDADEDGHTFYFKVNGAPVYMKGANYIPQDNFLDRVSHERYEHLLESAVEANMNMIRIWGGGIYEKKVFYDLCDEKGLLVWQDFMFACAMLPSNQDFLDNIRQEAVHNVKRLRNHPSIAMWCGNNESLAAWMGWGWKNRYDKENQKASEEIWTGYQKIFYEILPWAVAKYDGGKDYWPSSPSSAYTIPENLTSGDMHYWKVWHGKQPYEEYENNAGRFMSEYGFQAFPPFETVKTYTLPEDYDIESEVMLSHQRHPVGNQLIKEYMQRDFKDPKDFESFLYVSNVLQADIIKYAIEGFRRSMPYTMGSLYWQLNDCWPVASWSGIDYYGRWKAMHFAAKHAYAPVLSAPKVVDNEVHFYIVSDRLEAISDATLKIEVYDLSGKMLRDDAREITIKPNTSHIYQKSNVGSLLGAQEKNEVFIYTSIILGDEMVNENITYLVKPKDIDFLNTDIKYKVTEVEGGLSIAVSSKRFAPKVFLSVDEGGNFSDNYFNLIPGKPKTVTYKTDLSRKEFMKLLKVSYLNEAF